MPAPQGVCTSSSSQLLCVQLTFPSLQVFQPRGSYNCQEGRSGGGREGKHFHCNCRAVEDGLVWICWSQTRASDPAWGEQWGQKAGGPFLTLMPGQRGAGLARQTAVATKGNVSYSHCAQHREAAG